MMTESPEMRQELPLYTQAFLSFTSRASPSLKPQPPPGTVVAAVILARGVVRLPRLVSHGTAAALRECVGRGLEADGRTGLCSPTCC